MAFFPLFYKRGVKSIESNRSTVFALLFLLFVFLTLAFLSPLVALGIIVIRVVLKRIARLWGPEEVPKGKNAPSLDDAISPASAALLSKIEEEVRREAQERESSNPVP